MEVRLGDACKLAKLAVVSHNYILKGQTCYVMFVMLVASDCRAELTSRVFTSATKAQSGLHDEKNHRAD